MKKKAIEKYEDMLKEQKHIRSYGFVVSLKWPWLECSPDVIVIENGVPVGCVEIKCPHSCKDLCIANAVNREKHFLKQIHT